MNHGRKTQTGNSKEKKTIDKEVKRPQHYNLKVYNSKNNRNDRNSQVRGTAKQV